MQSSVVIKSSEYNFLRWMKLRNRVRREVPMIQNVDVTTKAKGVSLTQ